MKQAVTLALALTLGAATAKAQVVTGSADADFVLKASAGGMAEVNLGRVAAKSASDEAVRKFAQKMVDDHGKANKELLALANKKRLKVAAAMDAEHQGEFDKLLKLSGAALDRAYMAGQVKDHEDTVALFEKQAKEGRDEDLKKWAKDTLPHLREHLKMAKDVNRRLNGTGKR